MLEISNITNKIIRVSSSSTIELAKHFIRFQEYYESPYWRGKIFTIEEYEAWYKKTNGAFTYYQDWIGFNIPSWVLKPFYSGLFSPLSNKEIDLLNLFTNRNDDFYIIGSQDNNSLEHELAHGFFYTIKEYRDSVTKIISDNKEHLQTLFSYLANSEYHEVTHIDEAHAYAGVDIEFIKKKSISIPREVHSQLINLFESTIRQHGILL